MTAYPCVAGTDCVRNQGQYLCLAHWQLLPAATRRLLWKRDSKAMDRLQDLFQQIHSGIPLNEIEVSP